MTDILNEASALVECKECPWYKSCVTPMRFTTDDIKRQLSNAAPLTGGDTNLSHYLAEMASATQNYMLEGCPIFIERLRASPRLAERIKKIMQTWGRENEA